MLLETVQNKTLHITFDSLWLQRDITLRQELWCRSRALKQKYRQVCDAKC